MTAEEVCCSDMFLVCSMTLLTADTTLERKRFFTHTANSSGSLESSSHIHTLFSRKCFMSRLFPSSHHQPTNWLPSSTQRFPTRPRWSRNALTVPRYICVATHVLPPFVRFFLYLWLFWTFPNNSRSIAPLRAFKHCREAFKGGFKTQTFSFTARTKLKRVLIVV